MNRRADKSAPSRKYFIKLHHRPLLLPLWFCLLIALITRIWLIVRTHGILDGDEALVGIQAERILHGTFPVYFYGIPYFGSLEAYLASPFIAFFGPSTLALRTESTLLSLVLVYLTWRLASLLVETTHLPAYAKRCFTIVAALVAAVPPLYDGIVELRTWGGWIETFILMLLLLISALRLTNRWNAGASNRELTLRWAGIGFITGLGLWVYPLITMAILAAGTWIVGDRISEIIKRQTLAPLKKLALAAFAIPACLLGFLPGILWGARHQWANISYIRSLGGTWSAQRLHTVKLVTQMFGTCIAPHVIGGGTPLESTTLAAIHSLLFFYSLFFIVGTVALVALSFVWHHPLLVSVRRLAALPTLFATCVVILYCTGSASRFSLISCNLDLAGRYATPLALALPFFFATIFTMASTPTRAATRAPSPHPVLPRPYGMRDGRTTVVLQVIMFVLLIAYPGIQAWAYGVTNANEAFQSPYCAEAPANYDSIIAYMQQEHIRYAWATNLLAYPIVFKTNSNIIVVDPFALTHPPLVINRIPSYTDAVKNADRPSFLVFVRHGNPHPRLLQILDAEHVRYKAAFFPSEKGVDVMVVTPLSRTVAPPFSSKFDVFACYTQ
ncbi:MAG TPA: hypothetical protein VJ761_24305 [Ktedonobacteraceae bacterium]|nr:hypothetical protein [Ktedonobacteraceae bacterium]